MQHHLASLVQIYYLGYALKTERHFLSPLLKPDIYPKTNLDYLQTSNVTEIVHYKIHLVMTIYTYNTCHYMVFICVI